NASQSLRLPRHKAGAQYDAQLDMAIGIAANAGMSRGQTHAINYTTLLIGLAVSEDPVKRWLERQPNFRRDELFASRNFSASNVTEFFVPAIDAAIEQNLYSPSASGMLDRAAEIAESIGGSRSLICPRHLLAAYLFRTPSEHTSDLRRWISDTPDLPASFAK